MTLDQVETEIFNLEINSMPYKDTGSYVLRQIDDDLSTFEECELKI